MNRFAAPISVFVLLPLLLLALTAGTLPAETETASEGGIIRITVESGRISADLVDADVTAVLARISRETGVPVTTGPGVGGRVTVTFDNLPIDAAIARICHSRAMVYEYLPETDAYRVLRAGVFAESPPAASETSAGEADGTGPDTAATPGPETASRPIVGSADRASSVSPRERDRQGRLLYKPGELLVQWAPSADPAALDRLHATLGSRVLRRYDRRRIQRIALAPGMTEAGAMARYRDSGLVAHVERHALRYPTRVPDDPLYSQLWGMEKIAAPRAWDIQTGTAGVVVAVIDTGVDYLHPDLLDNIWGNPNEIVGNGIDDDNNTYTDDKYGYDFADDDASPLDTSNSGHGTHVAGTVAAVGNNANGVSGVSWTARVMALKVQNSGATYLETLAIIEAVDYAIANGATVVNCSFGGEAWSQMEADAFGRLEAAGVLAVCAAGNEGRDIDVAGNEIYPASHGFANIISVGASTQSDGLASFSNWGAASVDLMAPGVSIKSTVPSNNNSTEAYVTSGGDTFLAIGMLFAGTTDDTGITATLIDCGNGYPIEIPAAVDGNIALIERGPPDADPPMYFSTKVANAQDAGAVGVVIYNDKVDSLDQNGGTLQGPHDPPWIPAVSISLADGQMLKSRVGQPVTLVNRIPSAADAYAFLQGTSMATPMVSGAAALLYAADPGLTVTEAKTALLDYADPVPAASAKTVSGGRLNVWAAVCSRTNERGDVNCDGQVDLEDAIRTLQVVSGRTAPPLTPHVPGADTDGDAAIGMAEAVYVLQQIAGLRD